MSVFFNPLGSFLPITVRLFGLTSDARARLALDTGATQTMISRELANFMGYDLGAGARSVQLITASGEENATVVTIQRVEALEHHRLSMPVLCHDLPTGTPFDGLLGLDFLRGQRLTLDFREGLITLD